MVLVLRTAACECDVVLIKLVVEKREAGYIRADHYAPYPGKEVTHAGLKYTQVYKRIERIRGRHAVARLKHPHAEWRRISLWAMGRAAPTRGEHEI